MTFFLRYWRCCLAERGNLLPFSRRMIGKHREYFAPVNPSRIDQVVLGWQYMVLHQVTIGRCLKVLHSFFQIAYRCALSIHRLYHMILGWYYTCQYFPAQLADL